MKGNIIYKAGFAIAMLVTGVDTSYSADMLADPMRPQYAYLGKMSDSTEKILNTMKLTMTYVSEGHRYAVINGAKINEGDQVDGTTIVSILPGSVVMDRDGDKILLKVLPSNIKSVAADTRKE